jgi:U3 small nucleolar RNA-associated protein 10
MKMDLDMVKIDITAVVQCVAEASDVALRNQALTLLTAISRVSPDLVLKHVIDILTAIGASTITQNDNYSHEVAQQTLVAVVPCWLTTKEDPTTLLQASSKNSLALCLVSGCIFLIFWLTSN